MNHSELLKNNVYNRLTEIACFNSVNGNSDNMKIGIIMIITDILDNEHVNGNTKISDKTKQNQYGDINTTFPIETYLNTIETTTDTIDSTTYHFFNCTLLFLSLSSFLLNLSLKFKS